MPSTKGHENIFVDCGFSGAEAENLRIRADMIIGLRNYIRSKRITLAKAAKILGVSQPRVSDLMHGRVDLFSVDMLIHLLSQAGLRVEFQLSAAKRGKDAA